MKSSLRTYETFGGDKTDYLPDIVNYKTDRSASQVNAAFKTLANSGAVQPFLTALINVPTLDIIYDSQSETLGTVELIKGGTGEYYLYVPLEWEDFTFATFAKCVWGISTNDLTYRVTMSENTVSSTNMVYKFEVKNYSGVFVDPVILMLSVRLT